MIPQNGLTRYALLENKNPARNRPGVAQSPKLLLTGSTGYNKSIAACNKNPHATSMGICLSRGMMLRGGIAVFERARIGRFLTLGRKSRQRR